MAFGIQAITFFLRKPLVLPLVSIGVGFWFGSFDISYKITRLAIQSPDPDKLPKFYKFLSYIGGTAVGSSAIILRHYVWKAPTSFLTVPHTDEAVNFTSIFNNFKSALSKLKGFPFGYYALTVALSAGAAGIASAFFQKNINITVYNNKISSLVDNKREE
jgi:hypothetical protein